ncbi:MAG: hypothetical protein PHY42_01805, partial [Bacilli bacterium]|nr:hypothetical protein [Bacilli bacterium]
MNLRFYPGSLKGRIRIPSSKSLTHRALIAASLAKGTSIIHHPLFCDDTMATLDCLKNLGMNIKITKKTITLESPGFYSICGPLDVKESATTLRLLVGLISIYEHDFTIQCHPRIIDRIKTKDLEDLKGLEFSFEANAIHIKGTLNHLYYRPAMNITTQWASGLSLMMPLSPIYLHASVMQGDYVRLGVNFIKNFGVEIVEEEEWLRTEGTYLPQEIRIEVDYSSAAFFIGMALFNRQLRIEDIRRDSYQPDVRIISYFEQMGATFEVTSHYLRCINVNFQDCTIDLTQNPDLAPILAAVASVSSCRVILTGLEKLEYKESNRLFAIQNSLNVLGASVTIADKSLIIEGKKV